MLPWVCSVIDHRRRQLKCNKNIIYTVACNPFDTSLFLPHFDVICDLLLNRHTATWNLLEVVRFVLVVMVGLVVRVVLVIVVLLALEDARVLVVVLVVLVVDVVSCEDNYAGYGRFCWF